MSRLLCILMLLGFSTPALTQNRQNYLVKLCATCHGDNGISPNPIWPNLAGQKKDYLVKQLKDFKSGLRNNQIMGSLAQTLSDEDVATLAEYFSIQKNCPP